MGAGYVQIEQPPEIGRKRQIFEFCKRNIRRLALKLLLLFYFLSTPFYLPSLLLFLKWKGEICRFTTLVHLKGTAYQI